MDNLKSKDPDHFKKTFYLLAATLLIALVYVFLITFVPIPKENVRFADTTQGFFLGTIIAGVIGYFITGSPPAILKKNDTGQPPPRPDDGTIQ